MMTPSVVKSLLKTCSALRRSREKVITLGYDEICTFLKPDRRLLKVENILLFLLRCIPSPQCLATAGLES
jgi:hypothetical protein